MQFGDFRPVQGCPISDKAHPGLRVDQLIEIPGKLCTHHSVSLTQSMAQPNQTLLKSI